MNESQRKKYYAPKPCTFCGAGATYSPLDELDKHGVDVYFCHPCRAEYLYFWDGQCASTSLYTEINKKMYRWTISSSSAVLWYIKNPGTPGTRKNDGIEFIKAFKEDVPVITPQNVNEKLRTWLIFL